MRKILLILVFIFALGFTSFSQMPIDVSPWVGYSWVNGVVGADLQLGHIGISGGWMPTKMPYTNQKVNSYSGNFTFYGKSNKQLNDRYGAFGACWYASIGWASDGYRYESYGGSYVNDYFTAPMTIVLIGVKSYSNRFSMKAGFGYGWCQYGNAWTWEIGISYAIFSSHQ